MRLVAARSSNYARDQIPSSCGLQPCFILTCATRRDLHNPSRKRVRINVEPAEPGIRSITVDKKYRPIISRDDKGVVIDTHGQRWSTLPRL